MVVEGEKVGKGGKRIVRNAELCAESKEEREEWVSRIREVQREEGEVKLSAKNEVNRNFDIDRGNEEGVKSQNSEVIGIKDRGQVAELTAKEPETDPGNLDPEGGAGAERRVRECARDVVPDYHRSEVRSIAVPNSVCRILAISLATSTIAGSWSDLTTTFSSRSPIVSMSSMICEAIHSSLAPFFSTVYAPTLLHWLSCITSIVMADSALVDSPSPSPAGSPATLSSSPFSAPPASTASPDAVATFSVRYA